MKDFIVKVVDEEWLAEIEDKMMGFTDKTPIEILDHLEKRWGTLYYVNTNEIKKECDALWYTTEHIMAYFNRVKKSVKQLD